MFHLEYRLDQEAFRVAVLAAKSESFADDAAAWLTLNMDDEIACRSDLRFGVGEGGLRVIAHNQVGETMQGLLRRVGASGQQPKIAACDAKLTALNHDVQ
jgi:hypothetical protein